MENSIEEDTKKLEEEIKRFNKINNLTGTYIPLDALEHILSDYKRVLKENKEYYKQLDLDYTEKNFISKQKVKDKLEELKAQYKIVLEENSTKAFILKCQITILQEVLEREE